MSLHVSVSSIPSTQPVLSKEVTNEIKEIIGRNVSNSDDITKIKAIFAKHHPDSPLWWEKYPEMGNGTALSLATFHQRWDIAEALVKDLNADPKVHHGSFNPMHLILTNGPLRILELYVDHGGQVHDESQRVHKDAPWKGQPRANCLHALFHPNWGFYKKHKNNEVLRVNAYNQEQQEKTAYVAQVLGEQKIRELANQRDRYGDYPWHDLLIMVDYEIHDRLTWLVARMNKESINRKGGNGRVPFCQAISSNARAKDIKVLLDTGADLKIANGDGENAFHLLCTSSEMKEIFAMLVKAEIDVNALDNEQRTPLYRAIENKEGDLAALLLSHPKIDLKSQQGRTYLGLACQKINHTNFMWDKNDMRTKMLNFIKLLATKCDVNQYDVKGYAPLHYACAEGDTELVKVLEKAGAKLDLHTRGGRAPLSLLNKFHEDLRGYLQSKK